MLGKLRKRFKDTRGFTLIELIVVIAIIGILMMLAVPRLMGYTENAKETADEQLAALYRNTFQVLVGSGKLDTSKISGSVTISIASDGVPTVTGTGLRYRDASGAYANGGTDNTLGAGTFTPDSGWDDNNITVGMIQGRYLSKGGRGGNENPTFQSKAFQSGIEIKIDQGGTVTVTPKATVTPTSL